MATIIRQVGIYGQAYDPPGVKRAYTYAEQPGNVAAWRIGAAIEAFRSDTSRPGDLIDTGLKLLKHLEQAGFGVFELDDAAKGK